MLTSASSPERQGEGVLRTNLTGSITQQRIEVLDGDLLLQVHLNELPESQEFPEREPAAPASRHEKGPSEQSPKGLC
jgi:hypothetical protein